MPNSPFMNLALPVVGVTNGGGAGTSWGPMLTASLDQIDAHDHSPGKGAPMQAQASTFKVVGDLDFGGHNLFDIGNLQMSNSGTLTAWALTGSLTQLIPSGSTLPLAAFIGFGGIQVSTNSLGQVIISGSFPEVSDITGSGGTSILSSGTIWTVSSSVGAGRDGSYIVVAAVGGRAPNARIIATQGGVSVSDGGPGGNLTISGSSPQISNLTGIGGVLVTPNGSLYTVSGAIGTDKNAAFVLLAPNAQAPNARTLATQGSLVIVDGGPGGTFSLKNFEPWTDFGNALNTTSSVSIDTLARAAAAIGTDVYFFVSGTTGLPLGSPGRQVAVIGGNLVNSGSIHALRGMSVDINGASLAMIGSDVYFWVSGTQGVQGPTAKRPVFGGDALLSGAINVLGPASFDSQNRIPSQIGTDVSFFVSGTVGLPLGTPGRQVAVFGGNLVVSGTIHDLMGLSVDSLGASLGSKGLDVYMWVSGTQGLTGSAAKRPVFGGDALFSGAVNVLGPAMFDAQNRLPSQIGTDVYFFVSGTVGLPAGAPGRQAAVFGGSTVASGSITALSGAVIDSQGRFITSLGTDVFFYVSGTTGLTGGSAKRPVFGGDALLSGAINVLGPASFDSQNRLPSSLGTDVTFFVSGTVGIPVNTAGRQIALFGGGLVVSGTVHALSGVSVDTAGVSLLSKGTDVYMWVSGTTGLTGAGARKAVFGGDVTISGSLSSSIKYAPLTSSNWNPQPTTVQAAFDFLAAPHFSSSLAQAQTLGTVVSASIAPSAFAQLKSGVVNVYGTLVVNATTNCSGTAKLLRDNATQLGPTIQLPLTSQVPQAFSLQWIDTLPDTLTHQYSFVVSASVGTLSVLANQGGVTVRELN